MDFHPVINPKTVKELQTQHILRTKQMKNALFYGTEAEWYTLRLRHMYKVKPKCTMLHRLNHLIGTCPVCGLGNYTTSKRWTVRHITIDRIYPILCSPKAESLPNVVFARQQCQRLVTNTEFPIPIIRYQTFVHIPQFIDIDANCVIDFLPDTRRGKLLMQATDKVLSNAGYNYVVYSGETEIFRNHDLNKQARSALNAGMALQRIVARFQK